MSKIYYLFIFFVLGCSNFLLAQAPAWGGGADQNDLSFGFTFSYVSSNFKIVKKPDWRSPYLDPGTNTYLTDSLNSISSNPTPGFAVGFITRYRLTEHLEARATPSLIFADRSLTYAYATPSQNVTKQVQTTTVDFPFLLKLKSDRIGNFRAYMLGGLKYSMAIGSKLNSDAAADPLAKMVKNVGGFGSYEAGLGCDIYFEFFKLSPEIKISNSLGMYWCPKIIPSQAPSASCPCTPLCLVYISNRCTKPFGKNIISPCQLSISMAKIALITGVTSGIGEACAHLFAREKYNLILTGRRLERLEKLAKKLNTKYNTEIAVSAFDVRDRGEVIGNLEGLPAKWKKVNVLINNAGLSQGLDPVQKGSLDDWDTMIDTNIKGLLYVTKLVSNWMIDNKRGHIVNLGSIAGKEVYANGNVYCATKYAVDALSKAMRIDLVNHGIKVTAIHPGAVETEFSEVRFKGDKERAKKVYDGFEPLVAEDVAETIWFAVSRPPHVNINELTIMPTAQASATVIFRT